MGRPFSLNAVIQRQLLVGLEDLTRRLLEPPQVVAGSPLKFDGRFSTSSDARLIQIKMILCAACYSKAMSSPQSQLLSNDLQRILSALCAALVALVLTACHMARTPPFPCFAGRDLKAGENPVVLQWETDDFNVELYSWI